MSKKIIYSVWSDLTEKHTSVPKHKKESFYKYKDTLINLQKQYAFNCKSDYEIFNPNISDYTNTQFYKILKFEELTKYYDKVVYVDLDVISITKENIFSKFDFDKIGVYSYVIDMAYMGFANHKKYLIDCIRENKPINNMNRHSKLCAKKAMLLLHDVSGNDEICNTGVLIGNKKAAENLRFSENMTMMESTLQQAKDDTLYPDVYSKSWIKNNEIYFSFLLEKYKIDFNNIGIQWNYILDDVISKYTSSAYLIHQVNKDFYDTISRLN